MNYRGSGQIVLIILVIAVATGGIYYFKHLPTKNASPTVDIQPSASPTSTPNPEALSLEVPKNHSKINWKITKVTDKPIYLHFQGKKFGGEVPLTGQLMEGSLVDNAENNTLIEDYYQSNLLKTFWSRKMLQTPEFELGIVGNGRGGVYCEYREPYVFLGHKDDKVRLIKIESEVNPGTTCSEGAPAPAVFSGKRDIMYHIFISDPLPIEAIRQKEFEIS
jgi:hypothetical protein